MRVKILMTGQSGVGKTHLCVRIAKEIKAVLIDVDEKAEEIIQKLDAEDSVMRLSGTPFSTFINSLNVALKSQSKMVIIDSLTELMDIIKRHIKNKILKKGEFWMGGIQRQETTKIDPDLFIVTWELHPVIYDNVRDVLKAINSSGKSFIVTYHPPAQQSPGKVSLLHELIRIHNLVVSVSEDTVTIKNDVFFNRKGEMTADEFVDYVQKLLQANKLKEVRL